jgi:2-phospho-L-lactate transferase/gluconeogenesis factor (CofD/UPF0052 family)
MTQPGETTGMSLSDHVGTLFNYIADGTIDHILVNDKTLPEGDLLKYTSGGAAQVLAEDADRKDIKARGIHLIEGGFIDIRRGYVVHDADAAAYVIRTLTRNHILGHD